MENEFFYYFAYGSNLLERRLKLNSPNAQFYGVGFLRDYALSFCGYSKNWNGGTATIYSKKEYESISDKNEYLQFKNDQYEGIFGIIWKINKKHLPHLDAQEGVHMSEYIPIYVNINVVLVKQTSFLADNVSSINIDNDLLHLNYLSEKLESNPIKFEFTILDKTIMGRTYVKIPPDAYKFSLPSCTYKLVILKGAIESKLPYDYIRELLSIPINEKLSLFSAWKTSISDN